MQHYEKGLLIRLASYTKYKETFYLSKLQIITASLQLKCFISHFLLILQ